MINQKDVACRIYDLEDENTVNDQIGVIGGGATEFTVKDLNTDEGVQQFKWWAVRAFNTLGSSGFGKVSMLVGEPYALPYRQSFANQNQGGHILIMYVGAGMNAALRLTPLTTTMVRSPSMPQPRRKRSSCLER